MSSKAGQSVPRQTPDLGGAFAAQLLGALVAECRTGRARDPPEDHRDRAAHEGCDQEQPDLLQRLAAGEQLVAAAQDGYRLSEARTRNGVDSHLSLLDAQRTLYGAEQELIATRLAEVSNRVALVKALGGGWQ